ncbi:MAG: cell division protein ZapA [Pontibacterium sp.]
MNKQPPHTVSIRLLDKEYSINCPEGAESELQAAAAYLDKKMSEIRYNGKLVGLERITVMAALNISHELMIERAGDKAQQKTQQQQNQQLERLNQKIADALNHEGISRKADSD